eukprot:m.94421 g.94421  ORF g.94421 m.94421 type:complete len:204 (+) comp12414_c1_seq4:125-736(+)
MTSTVLQDFVLQGEMLLCRKELSQHVLIHPSVEDPLVWDFAMFVPKGVYACALFKGQLFLPPDYPSSTLPIVLIKSKIAHPSISQEGVCDLGSHSFGGFYQWDKRRHKIYSLMNNICRGIFSTTMEDIINMKKGEDGVCDNDDEEDEDRHSIMKHRATLEVDDCMRDSDFNAYTPESSDFSIKFKPWSEEMAFILQTLQSSSS